MAKILIADDNEGVRKVLMQCLRAPDRLLLTADDGDEALAVARLDLPDLIILDVRMPGRDGHEVCAALRANERTRKIPILMLTGLGDVSEEVKGIDNGVDDYMVKPFKLGRLQARVGALLRRGAQLPPAAG